MTLNHFDFHTKKKMKRICTFQVEYELGDFLEYNFKNFGVRMDAINVGVSLFMVVTQVVTIVLGALALGGGTWIEGVENRGDYFTRIQSTDNSHAYMSDGDMHSMGMWRYFTKPGVSNPLPLRGTLIPLHTPF